MYKLINKFSSFQTAWSFFSWWYQATRDSMVLMCNSCTWGPWKIGGGIWGRILIIPSFLLFLFSHPLIYIAPDIVCLVPFLFELLAVSSSQLYMFCSYSMCLISWLNSVPFLEFVCWILWPQLWLYGELGYLGHQFVCFWWCLGLPNTMDWWVCGYLHLNIYWSFSSQPTKVYQVAARISEAGCYFMWIRWAAPFLTLAELTKHHQIGLRFKGWTMIEWCVRHYSQ